MEKYVITISRQYGSFGRLVAKELSRQLHIDFMDRDIVEETAKRMNTSIKEISHEEEDTRSWFSYHSYPFGLGTPDVQDEIFLVQQSIIRDFARKGSCIIVGRCGAYCLREEKRLLRVYIYAPYEVRVKNCVEYFGMTEKEAVRAVNEADKARESYHKKYIPGYKSDTLNSDLCINSAYYSIDEAAELITKAAQIKFGELQ